MIEDSGSGGSGADDLVFCVSCSYLKDLNEKAIRRCLCDGCILCLGYTDLKLDRYCPPFGNAYGNPDI